MIHTIEEIKITEKSYPFASAEKYCGLSKKGYSEKEYYMSGTANIYQTVNERESSVIYENAPYINRFIIRGPEDRRRFSGNIIVEIINPTAFFEIDRMWILGKEEFIRSGDIYIGITSKPNTLAKLKEFDADRYGRLNWDNPTPDRKPDFDPAELKQTIRDYNPSYETGLFWDMLTDLARLLRSEDDCNPVKMYENRMLFLTGWSQSACYLMRYMNSFAFSEQIEKDGPIFDGYLAGGAVRALVTPLNQYEAGRQFGLEYRMVHTARAPFIDVQTESENGRFSGNITAKKDSDDRDFKYRLYNVTGASHDTRYSLVDYYAGDADMKRLGILPGWEGLEPEANNYPSEILFAAAFRNLFTWAKTGKAPKSCKRIPVYSDGENKKDAFGNSIGGLRTCLLDFPTGRFSNTSTVPEGRGFMGPKADKNGLFGSERPFSESFLTELYGSLEDYRKMILPQIEQQIADGFVLKEDRDTLIACALERAGNRGLK